MSQVWAAPSSIPTSGTTYQTGFLIDSWVSVRNDSGSIYVNYLTGTDPSGTWSTSPAMPALTGGYTYSGGAAFATDGTTYAVALLISKTGPSRRGTAIFYTTNLGATWSLVQLTTSLSFEGGFAYGNGSWIVTGTNDTAANSQMAYASSLSGSWTTSTGTAGDQWSVIGYHAGTWGRFKYVTATGAWTLEKSTTIGGAFTTSTSGSAFTANQLRFANGLWLLAGGDPSGSQGSVLYGDIATGSFASSNCNYPSSSFILDVDYLDGIWTAVGQTSSGADIYYATGTDPSATFSQATFTFSSPSNACRSVHGEGRWWITNAASAGDVVRVSRIVIGPTYLRQRQSPVRTPSRIRGVDTRLRQTPTITK